jgi:hypothetical protein
MHYYFIRLDSDVPWFYGKVTDKVTGKDVAPALNPEWREPPEDYTSKQPCLLQNHFKSFSFFVH